MTYKQIFKEIYYENKKFIRAYVTICLVFSILAFGSGNFVHANSNFTSAEVLETVGGSFGKMAILLPCVQSFLGDIDQPTVMLISSAIPFFLKYMPGTLATLGDRMGIEGLEEGLANYSFGLFENDIFKAICLVWFVLAKLSKSNRLTCSTSLILENKASKIGGIINGIVVVSQFLANIPLGETVYATATTPQPAESVKYLNTLVCFVSLMSLSIIYLFVRFLFRFISILLHPIHLFVRFSALVCTVTKSFGVGILILIALRFPYVFCALFVLILLIAILLFKKAYITIRYFKNIYVKPFFKKFRGYDSEIPLVSPKMPKKVKQYIKDADVEMIIPVYLIKRLDGLKFTHCHDRWWFVSAKDKQYICKPCFMKNTCYSIELNNTDEKKMFIKKSIRFFEIFNLKGSEQDICQTFRRAHKRVHFVFSKEYYYRFEKIKELTAYTDYTEYKKQLKQDIKLSRKEKREQKRLERLEAKEERRIARHKSNSLA